MTWLLVTRRPFGPALALLGLIPRHPYSAVPFPSNWELWRNFPDALQQSSEGKDFGPSPNRVPRELRSGWYLLNGADGLGELQPELPVGHARNMTVSWRWRRCGRFERSLG